MSQKPMTERMAAETLAAVEKYGSQVAAAKALGIPRGTLQARHRAALQMQQKAYAAVSAPIEEQPREKLLEQIADLRAELRRAQVAPSLTEEYVKSKILGLSKSEITVPEWLTRSPRRASDVTGVPILFASDWHWGEVVDPAQIGGVNKFDMDVAHRRAQRLIARSIELCFNHLANPRYDGIVFALGGDMVSGSIHEELEITNQKPIMPVVVDLIGVLIRCISELADKFGRVFVPCVTGNHGRNHKKPRAKDRVYDNFDWLIYQLLSKHFEDDPRISFLIPDGSDCSFAVYSHRYLLTHGDQFRGGDGMIGMLGPVTRGDMKKRARNAQIDLEYDTMIIGHWHQLHMGNRTIVNGSLKGFDEYAYASNFGFEMPQQALWVTHPTEGITFRMEVHLEDKRSAIPNRDWVSVRT
jgi:hypothetical protein